METIDPQVAKVKAGWFALGTGWAVFAATEEEARSRYNEALERHRTIMERPDPLEDHEDA